MRPPAVVPDETVREAANALRAGEPCVILLGGAGLRQPGLDVASRIAAANPNARLIGETFAARQERGAGRPAIDRLAYLAEYATAQLEGARHLILAGARSRILGKPSRSAVAEISTRLNMPTQDIAVIGDDLGMDIALGRMGGSRTVLVRSGISGAIDLDRVAPKRRPDAVIDGVAELLERL